MKNYVSQAFFLLLFLSYINEKKRAEEVKNLNLYSSFSDEKYRATILNIGPKKMQGQNSYQFKKSSISSTLFTCTLFYAGSA